MRFNPMLSCWSGGLALGLVLMAGLAAAAEYHVAPDGTAQGDGSAARPWNLATALAHPAGVKPGDTIWLHGGTYRPQGNTESTLTGEPGKPIIVRQAPGERATIDMGDSNRNRIHISGAHAWYWGFEMMSSAPDRVAAHTSEAKRGLGLSVSSSEAGAPLSPGLKFINLVIHDLQGGGGIAFWRAAIDGEIYGCLIYYNGCNNWQHGIYTQNDEGTKRIVDNIIFANAGWGVHAYGSERASLNNFHLEGNITFNNGILFKGYNRNLHIGGGRVAENPVVLNNCSYLDPSVNGGIACETGYGAGCRNATVRDNYFIAPAGNALWLKSDGAVVTGNTFYGGLQGCDAATFPDNVYLRERPQGVRAFVRPNVYEPGRAHICVFNWDNQDEVRVDVASVLKPGEAYEVKDAQNYFGPAVATGTYSGAPIALPMNLTAAAQAIGEGQIGSATETRPFKTPPHTAREFGAFVLMKVGN